MPPWDKYAGGTATVAPAGPPAFIPAAPNPRLQRADARAEAGELRAQQDQGIQIQQITRGIERDAESDRRWDATNARQDRIEARANQPKFKPFVRQQDYETRVGSLMEHQRLLSSFNDDFSGTGAGMESFAQGYVSSVGTPGQRDWWAGFNALDNQVRNGLFGASLTPGEKAAYEATSVTQGMDATEIRKNVGRRTAILQAAMQRQTRFQLAHGTDPAEIEALAGSLYGDLSGQDATEQPAIGPQPDATATLLDGGSPTAPPIDPNAPKQGDVLDDGSTYGGSVGGELYKPLPESAGMGAGLVYAEDGTVYRDVNGTYEKAGTLGSDVKTDAAGRFMLGASDSLTGGSLDEIGSGADAVAGALSGDGSFSDLYGVNLAKNRAVQRQAQSDSSGEYGLGQVLGAALPAGALGRVAAGTRVGTTAFRAGVAGDAAYGAIYGAGSGESAGGRAGNALAGLGLGAAGSAGIRRLTEVAAPVVGNALARLGRNPSAEGQAVARAAASENVSIMPADVAGPGIRRATAAAAQMPLGARPIIQGAKRTADTFDAATSRVANDMGTPLDDVDLGDTVRRGAERFSDRTSATGGRLYERADRMARGVKIRAQGSVAEFTSLLDEFGQAGGTNKALVDELTRIGGDVFDAQTGTLKPQSLSALQDIRSNLRTMARNPDLRGTRATYAAGRLEKALTTDIEGGLTAAGRTNAVGALRKADGYWQQRVEHIDEVLQPLLGKGRSGEDVAKAVSSLVQGRGGGVARLRGVMNSMTPDEAGNFKSTVVDGLGKPGPGARGADGEGFSVATFLTNWNKMTPRAKAALFGAGEHRASLDNLATVAAGVKDSSRFANSSQTGGVMGWLTTLGSAAADLKTLGGYSLSQAMLGKALASPKLVTILTKPARTATQRAERVVELGRLSARYPALTEPADALSRALQSSPTRAAAEGGQEQNGRQPPPQ